MNYKFSYKIKAPTYRFDYSYCDRMIIKENKEVILDCKHNIFKNTNNKDFIIYNRNINQSKNINVKANDYNTFCVKNLDLIRKCNLIDIDIFKKLFNIDRLVDMCSSVLLDRLKESDINIFNNLLLYRLKYDINYDKVNHILNYQVYRKISMTGDYFFKRQNNLIFKPPLKVLYRPFKDFYLESLTYNLILIKKFIYCDESLGLCKSSNNMIINCGERAIYTLNILFDDFIDILTSLKELEINKILNIYLHKDIKEVSLNRNKYLQKDYKAFKLLFDICLDKEIKDILSLSDIYIYKYYKPIRFLIETYTYKYYKPVKFLIETYLIKEEKDILASKLKFYTKFYKDIIYNKSLVLDKYDKSINTFDLLYMFDKYKELKQIYLYQDLIDLETNLKMLNYSFDYLFKTDLKIINNQLLKQLSISNRIIMKASEINANIANYNIISSNPYKSLKTFERFLFYCNDIFTSKDNKNLKAKEVLYFLSKYLKSADLLGIKTLSLKKVLDIYINSNDFLVNRITKIKGIEIEDSDIYKLKLWLRFWFLFPKGQTDNLILPNCDYPYETEPIEGINKHPIQANIDIDEIPLSINIMVDLINILIFIWFKFYNAFWGCTGSQAVLDAVMYVYEWLTLETSIDEQLKKGSKEHYSRCYKWLRWEAEKVILIARNDNNLNGNYYVQLLIENLIQYMLAHHFDVMPVFNDIQKMDEWRNIFDNHIENDIEWVINKLKGIRHRTLEKLKEESQ